MNNYSSTNSSASIGIKIVSVYSLLIGIGALVLATQGSLLHLVLVPISLAAAYGLWRRALWGLGAAILLFLVETVRSGIEAFAGDTGAIITVALSLLLILYLSQRVRQRCT